MKILFVHQNFPAQYLHLARHMAASADNEVVCITQRRDYAVPGVKTLVYEPHRRVTPGIHHYLGDTEAAIINAQAVMRVAMELKDAGFMPDVMLGHNGWGETWYLKEVFPATPLIGYFEFFYRLHGSDMDFDPSTPHATDTGPRIRTKNLGNLLGLEAADLGQCATQWQKSLYPARYHDMLHVVHEGIDTEYMAPSQDAQLSLPGGKVLTPNDEVVTYVARNLEPYRGFPQFMRSLPAILAARPAAHVVIVGGDEISYGQQTPNGQTHREQLLKELDGSLDLSRVHFLGKVPYSTFRTIVQVSSAHVYLTYPFVLSWSMLEAMSAGALVIGSRSAPVEEVIREGENGLLVDFFSPKQIAARVVNALQDRGAYASIRANARRTIIENYDLKTICLPQQLQLLARVLTQ